MMHNLSGSMVAMLVFASGAALAAGSNASGDASPKPAPAVVVPVTASGLFNKPVFLRGTLGDVQIQANVRPKAEIDEGVEGEYFVFGRSQKILLAGELEGDAVFLEESENGTDVSGQWDGKRDGDTIHGTWLSADGSVSKPFMLKAVQAAKQPQAKPVQIKPLKP
jgi:hypothetical protein